MRQRVIGQSFYCSDSVHAQRLEAISQFRETEGQAPFTIETFITRHSVVVASQSSKVDILKAVINQPLKIVSEHLISALEAEPCRRIDLQGLFEFEIRYQLNRQLVSGKKIVLMDSVCGIGYLEGIIRHLGGEIVSIGDFMFRSSVDIVISNRNSFFRAGTDTYAVMTEGKLIDAIIKFVV